METKTLVKTQGTRNWKDPAKLEALDEYMRDVKCLAMCDFGNCDTKALEATRDYCEHLIQRDMKEGLEIRSITEIINAAWHYYNGLLAALRSVLEFMPVYK